VSTNLQQRVDAAIAELEALQTKCSTANWVREHCLGLLRGQLPTLETNTTSAAAEVAGVKEAERSTGSYTADNEHSNSVAAAGHSSACAHEGFYYCKKCGKDLTPEIGEQHGRYNDSTGSARSAS
jgi:hypothetical protein